MSASVHGGYAEALAVRLIKQLANGRMASAAQLAEELSEPVGEVSLLLSKDDRFYDLVGHGDGRLLYGVSELGEHNPASVGERMRIARGVHTQSDFATVLGISLTSLGKYERGERTPPWSVLKSLRDLGYSSDWILTGTGTHKRASQALAEPEALISPAPLVDQLGELTAGLAALQQVAIASTAMADTLANLATACECLRLAHVRELRCAARPH